MVRQYFVSQETLKLEEKSKRENWTLRSYNVFNRCLLEWYFQQYFILDSLCLAMIKFTSCSQAT